MLAAPCRTGTLTVSVETGERDCFHKLELCAARPALAEIDLHHCNVRCWAQNICGIQITSAECHSASRVPMTIRTVGLRIALLSALCSCTAVTFAAGTAASDGTPDPKAFIELAAQDGMTEVQLGELALRNSKNPHVRQFAQQMIDDHGKANIELVGIAQQKNVIAAKKLDAKHTAMVHDLSTKYGSDF